VTDRTQVRLALAGLAEELDRLLAVSDAQLAAGYPRTGGYQPVHTAYVPADKFGSDTVRLWGSQALAALAEFAPDPAGFADVFGLSRQLADRVRLLVQAKLTDEPIEDLRVDFEDGYGTRAGHTEDAHARAAARSLREVLAQQGAPRLAGIRCKSLEPTTRRRAVSTIEAFLEAFCEFSDPPFAFLITLPKVTSAAQVTAMNVLCERFELAYRPPVLPWRLQFEIQVETPQLVLGADGAATVARCVHAGGDRLAGLSYGTYDYSAALGVSADYQSLEHPAADYAKAVMQVAAAGTGVSLSDGSSNVLPAGNPKEVIAAWRLHARLVRRSLERGFYQGWDLHPAQLVSRYAATYAFYREGVPAAAARLRSRTERAAAGQEEPATIRALADFLVRAQDCGAATEIEISGGTGLKLDQLRIARFHGRIVQTGSL